MFYLIDYFIINCIDYVEGYNLIGYASFITVAILGYRAYKKNERYYNTHKK